MTDGGAAHLSAGVVIGVVVGHTLESIIENLLLPLLSLAFGHIPIQEMHLILRDGNPAGPYSNVSAASDSGAIVLKYGMIVTNILSLLFVIIGIFLTVKVLNRIQRRWQGSRKVQKTSAQEVPMEDSMEAESDEAASER